MPREAATSNGRARRVWRARAARILALSLLGLADDRADRCRLRAAQDRSRHCPPARGRAQSRRRDLLRTRDSRVGAARAGALARGADDPCRERLRSPSRHHPRNERRDRRRRSRVTVHRRHRLARRRRRERGVCAACRAAESRSGPRECRRKPTPGARRRCSWLPTTATGPSRGAGRRRRARTRKGSRRPHWELRAGRRRLGLRRADGRRAAAHLAAAADRGSREPRGRHRERRAPAAPRLRREHRADRGDDPGARALSRRRAGRTADRARGERTPRSRADRRVARCRRGGARKRGVTAGSSRASR